MQPTMSGYRTPFSSYEEKIMLDYIKKNAYHQLRGYKFWKALVEEKLNKRTYYSLHERFRKHIVPNLHNPAYCLSREEQQKIKTMYEETAQKNRKPRKESDESHSVAVLPPESTLNDSTDTNATQEQEKNVQANVDKKLAQNFFEMSDSDSSNSSTIFL